MSGEGVRAGQRMARLSEEQWRAGSWEGKKIAEIQTHQLKQDYASILHTA
jgi:hypothetical protein